MAIIKNRIVLVGCGPGSLDYLIPAGRRAIEQAQVLAGTPQLLKSFFDDKSDPQKFLISVGTDIQGALDHITRHLHQRVAVLVTGDPGLCSLAKPVIARFGRDVCHVIPGISSVQAAFASVGIDWLDARVFSAHERIPSLTAAQLKAFEKIAILAGSAGANQWLAGLTRELEKEYQVFLCSHLTLQEESVCTVTAAALERTTIPPRTVVLLIRKGLL